MLLKYQILSQLPISRYTLPFSCISQSHPSPRRFSLGISNSTKAITTQIFSSDELLLLVGFDDNIRLRISNTSENPLVTNMVFVMETPFDPRSLPQLSWRRKSETQPN
jgi:hypothetical protein